MNEIIYVQNKIDVGITFNKLVGLGLPQGSVPGPIRFALFVNDLIENGTKAYLSTDQTIITVNRNFIEELKKHMIEVLDNVSSW